MSTSERKKATREALRCVAEKKFYLDGMNRLQAQMQGNLNDWPIAIIEERLWKLQRDFKSLETKVKQVVCSDMDEKEKETAQTEFCKAEALMFDIVGKLKARMQDLQMNETQSNEKASQSSETKCMEMSVQQQQASKIDEKSTADTKQKRDEEKFATLKFDGKMQDWCKFDAWLSENVTANENLDEKLKREILTDALSDSSVINMLDGLSNFDKMRAELYDIFDSTYKIAQQSYRDLNAIEKIKNASNESIMKLIKEVDECVRIFEKKIPTDFNVFVTYAVIDKFDRATMLAWERHRETLSVSWARSNDQMQEASKYMPNWLAVRDFLKAEAKFYLSIDGNKAESSKSAWSNAAKQSTSTGAYTKQGSGHEYSAIKCFVCGGGHPVKRCDDFKSLPLAERVACAENRKWCKQCLCPMHDNKPCKDATQMNDCPKCDDGTKHNSLLCPKSRPILKATVQPQRQSKPEEDDEEW